MADTASNKISSLPPIGALLGQSWQTFTRSLLSLFMLQIAVVVMNGLVLIVFILAFIVSGAGSLIVKNGWQGLTANLAATLGPVIGMVAVAAILLLIITSIIMATFQIAAILLVDSEGKMPLGEALKKSFPLIIPLFLTGILTFVLTMGGFFVFILPAILFYFLLIFTQFEVVLNHQRWTTAVKRSVILVGQNFGAILVRLLIITLIYIGVVIVAPNLLGKLTSGAFIRIVSFIVGLFLGWYMLAYHITLYKQAKAQVTDEKGKSMAWMWAVAVIGWVMAGVIFFLGYKTLSSGILNELFKKAASNSPGTSIQRSIDQMKPEAAVFYKESQQLFKQLRALQKDSSKSDAYIVAETKRLNDENIALLKKALEIEPNNPKIWFDLGNAYTWVSSAGSLEDGLAAYQKAEGLDPKNIIYVDYVGEMLIKMGKYEEAVLQLQKSLRIGQDIGDESGMTHYRLGLAYAGLKIYDSAKIHLQKAIEILSKNNSSGAFDDDILRAQKDLSNLPK